MCGEKHLPREQTRPELGSPPRVRGKAPFLCYPLNDQGITPACAGKSDPVTEQRAVAWDHPRVCGEKCLCFLHGLGLPGSPPRVRGKANRCMRRWKAFWITPACAGKSNFLCIVLYLVWDHPRVCGEKFRFLDRLSAPEGSPPRVRGKGAWPAPVLFAGGITPACAGKRGLHWIGADRLWDHPRVCGEKSP